MTTNLDLYQFDVLHVTQPTEEGVGKFVRDMVTEQLSAGLSVALASPDDPGFLRGLAELGCKHFTWDSVRSPNKNLLSERRQLNTIIRDCDPRILHLHSSQSWLGGQNAGTWETAYRFSPARLVFPRLFTTNAEGCLPIRTDGSEALD